MENKRFHKIHIKWLRFTIEKWKDVNYRVGEFNFDHSIKF
jgi:hypothetical protein